MAKKRLIAVSSPGGAVAPVLARGRPAASRPPGRPPIPRGAKPAPVVLPGPERPRQAKPTPAERAESRLAKQRADREAKLKAQQERLQFQTDLRKQKVDAAYARKNYKLEANQDFQLSKIDSQALLKANRAAMKNTSGAALADVFTQPDVQFIDAGGGDGGGAGGGAYPVDYGGPVSGAGRDDVDVTEPGRPGASSKSSIGPKTKIWIGVAVVGSIGGWMAWRYVTTPIRYGKKIWNAGAGVGTAVSAFRKAMKG